MLCSLVVLISIGKKISRGSLSYKLENLRKVYIYEDDSLDMLLGRCPNLQELDVYFNGSICLKLESLTQLQVLHLTLGSIPVVSELHLPSNLKKLVTGTPIESEISFIAGLPSLEDLQLWYSVKSKEWCLGDITFHNLKFSRLDASEESFPVLETLVIRGCGWLEEIPLSFADIPSLNHIRLIRCNESLGDSAVRIKEEVEAIEGWDRLNLVII